MRTDGQNGFYCTTAAEVRELLDVRGLNTSNVVASLSEVGNKALAAIRVHGTDVGDESQKQKPAAAVVEDKPVVETRTSPLADDNSRVGAAARRRREAETQNQTAAQDKAAIEAEKAKAEAEAKDDLHGNTDGALVCYIEGASRDAVSAIVSELGIKSA